MSLFTKPLNTPVGKLKMVGSDRGLVALLWESDQPGRVSFGDLTEHSDHPVLLSTEKEIREYFSATRTSFSIPLDVRGTLFQKQVWEALLGIPFGKTRTYGQLAAQLRNPLATRAVGAANAQNPMPIVIPCHRVIGASGKLTGFAGGLEAKDHLLQLEGRSPGLFR